MTSIVWVKPEGAELAEVDLGKGRLRATGSAIGGDPLPYRLEYELTTGERWITARLLVEASGEGWRRSLELINRPEGEWTVSAKAEGRVAEGYAELPPPGGDAAALAGALDCDLGLSPLTNTMPVLRGGFLEGGRAEHLMAWVSVPDLVVTPSRQTYRHVRRGVVNYADDGFTEDIVFGPDGIVEDYPSIGRRVRPSGIEPRPVTP
ncbi:putative glycolipid-binding domain-containing protein [Actinomadura rudentiformis]|uniref:Putative glycolipid-binding domain-containing protein n=1 Tax=Actinomadura rudentiformis TaxID=359158 RepID=A0A6H9YHY5_9ACTN|nr:putative glycolipid-binding domain-containing protein [Actinomadura rudentiformis]KAB2345549.1 putative glycolipid-binding domain-containing protein [Actinomadura rudentiformis]